MLMLVGNAGFITAVSSLILSFVDGGGAGIFWKILFIVAGSALLLTLASSKWVDRHLSNLISRALNRYTSLEVKDYAGMLRLAGDYQSTGASTEKKAARTTCGGSPSRSRSSSRRRSRMKVPETTSHEA